jgi:hypothetical protein
MFLEVSRTIDALDLATPPTLYQIWNALHIVWVRDIYCDSNSLEEVARITQLFSRHVQPSSGIYSMDENP